MSAVDAYSDAEVNRLAEIARKKRDKIARKQEVEQEEAPAHEEPEPTATECLAAPVPLARDKGGRPRILKPDERNLELLGRLGSIQATTREASAFFRVSEPTFLKFVSDFPLARAVWDEAREQGRMSLRRTQLNQALSGNPTMLVWLGKQYLGQTDVARLDATVKQETTHIVDSVDLAALSRDERDMLRQVAQTLLARKAQALEDRREEDEA